MQFSGCVPRTLFPPTTPPDVLRASSASFYYSAHKRRLAQLHLSGRTIFSTTPFPWLFFFFPTLAIPSSTCLKIGCFEPS